MSELYFSPAPRGKHFTRVKAEGIWRDIYQDHPVDCHEDAEAILRAIMIPTTSDNLEYYFPDTKSGKLCPTLELFELTIVLDPTNPNTKKQKGEIGV